MYCRLQETKLCRNTKLYCDRKARRWAGVLGRADGRAQAWARGQGRADPPVGRAGARAGARRASVLVRAGRACWGAQGGTLTGASRHAGTGRRASAGGLAGWRGAPDRRTLGRRRRAAAERGARGSWAQAQAGGSGARGASGRALGARQGVGRAALARGLAKGCALGALSLFLARFDSVFFLSQIFGHCS